MSVLSVRHLNKRFGGNVAVEDLSFDLEAGELLALIGPNGAGKSTTFNMIGGQLSADSGSVALHGMELLGKSPYRIAQSGVGRTFQITATFSSLTVRENVQAAMLAGRRRIFGFWEPACGQYTDEALDLLGQVGMRDQAARPCSELAYGDVKRVELAMSLASSPRLLLMDEQTAGKAPAERHALLALVKELVAQRNMAVLFTEHSMDVVFTYADRVAVLARGRLIAEGEPGYVRNHPMAREVYFGSGATFQDMLDGTGAP